MIKILTHRLRGMVMYRYVRIGPIVYEYDRGEATKRVLRKYE